MEKAIVLRLRQGKGTFSNSFDSEEDGEQTVITMKQKKSALRKLKKVLKNENVIVSHSDKDSLIFNEKLRAYDKLSYKTILPVIERILRQMAEKYSMVLPFDEVYICASAEIVCELLPRICEIGKLYTLISPELSYEDKDGFYYNYGCIIRGAERVEYSASISRIIIRADDTKIPLHISVPVFDLSENPASGNNILKAADVCVYDDRIKVLSEKWGGKCGLSIYQLIDKTPDESSVVDIYQKADSIFLLDIDRI